MLASAMMMLPASLIIKSMQCEAGGVVLVMVTYVPLWTRDGGNGEGGKGEGRRV